VNGLKNPKKQVWTPLEGILWIVAVIVFLAAGILVLLDVVGSWALYVAVLTSFIVVSFRYGAQIKRGEAPR
jgi:hypothetical protein